MVPGKVGLCDNLESADRVDVWNQIIMFLLLILSAGLGYTQLDYFY